MANTMVDPRARERLHLFEALAERHRGAIYGLAYRLTGNRDDAEDLVQDTLIEAFRAFARFTAGTRFDRWVCQIMTRNFIDSRRRSRVRRCVPLDDVSNGMGLSDRAADPQAIVESRAREARLQEALNQIPPEFRAAVMLCDGQGFSYEEASRALRCPVGTVRSRLHRAREQLRQLLRELARKDGE